MLNDMSNVIILFSSNILKNVTGFEIKLTLADTAFAYFSIVENGNSCLFETSSCNCKQS